MEDPLLEPAGLPGMRSLGNGPLPDDGVDRTPTERYLYNTRASYDSKGWSKCFLSTDGRSLLGWLTTNGVTTHPLKDRIPDIVFVSNEYYGVPTLENKFKFWQEYAETEFCWIGGFAEALRRQQINGSQDAKDVLIDFLGFLGARIVWSVKCCNQPWMDDRNTPIIEKSLTWLKRNKLFHPCIKHISIDFDPRDEFHVLFAEDFVALCRYISTNLPVIESAILWLTIAEDDFHEVSKSPMKFSWVRAFRKLPVEKVDICPLLIKSGESDAARKKRLRRSISGRDENFWDFHNARLGIKSLFLNDTNNERGLITHILTPGSKLWGYTDDIDDDTYISLQYMESWLSYTDDIADDAYISLQYMEGWNKKPSKSRRFRNIKKFRKLMRLQRYQLPCHSPPNQRVPQQQIQRAPRAAFRNLLPGDGWPRSIWYQMKF
ncbi:hypothetical protein EAE96_011292 [Botrytis aclada]|nr:hypothetical protein EAE96_011292 [Botrytis aclada]